MEASDLETMLLDIGVDVTRVSDKEVYAHCPQPDRHPNGDQRASWSINTETGAHFCFSCGYRGSLRSLVQDLTGEVPRDLGETIKRSKISRGIERARKRYERKPVETEPEIFVSEYQLNTYTNVPEWACRERNIDPDEMDFFGVHWDDKKEHYIIPVRDADGHLLGWQEKGPRFFKNTPAGMVKSKSLFGFDVFHGTRAILVESPLDVVRLASVGFYGGLSSFGVHVSVDQIRMLFGVADTVVLALDNDSAGKAETVRIVERYARVTRLKFVRYRANDPKDVGEMSYDQIHRLLSRAVVPGTQRYVHR